MADDVQQVRKTTVRNGDTVQTVQEVRNPDAAAARSQYFVANIIWYIAGILETLLALRFLLALLGANQANGFAHVIYAVSYPFVKPFFSLFSYDLRYGISRFEAFTLVAMALYGLIAYGLARLVTLNRPSSS